jgi:GTP-binding protein
VSGADDAAEDVESGRRLFLGACRFVAGAAEAAAIPASDLPEVALIGRSNVGKSSLLNALVGRSALARVSSAPGRTRQINLFDLGGRLMIADLPGYGFARLSKGERAGISRLAKSYLRGRAELRRVCLLVDVRHGLKDSDRAAMKALDEAGQSYVVVLTKRDAVSAATARERAAAAAAEAAAHVAAFPRVFVTSARDGGGIPELRAHLAALARARDIR